MTKKKEVVVAKPEQVKVRLKDFGFEMAKRMAFPLAEYFHDSARSIEAVGDFVFSQIECNIDNDRRSSVNRTNKGIRIYLMTNEIPATTSNMGIAHLFLQSFQIVAKAYIKFEEDIPEKFDGNTEVTLKNKNHIYFSIQYKHPHGGHNSHDLYYKSFISQTDRHEMSVVFDFSKNGFTTETADE